MKHKKIIKIISNFIYIAVMILSIALSYMAYIENKIILAFAISAMAGIMLGIAITKYFYNVYLKK
jgi:hypothetical protein